MLKWKRNKCGGSHPEGLDRLDSAPSRKTKSCKITITAGTKSSSKAQRKSNSHFTRSISEMDLSRLNFNNENETYKPIMRSGSFCSAIPDNVMSPSLSSPYVSANSQLEDIYQRFAERASASVPTSPQSDEDIATIITPKACQKASCGSLRRTSPTCLPCIEEAAESDELISIPDSGICDEEYDDRTKHYFEPLKFHDDEGNERINHNEYLPSPHLNNNNNSTSNNSEQSRKFSPLPRSYSFSGVNTNTQSLPSSHLINNSPFELNSRSKPIDIDNNKNTDLCDSTLGQKPIKNQDPHSLM